VRWHGCTGAQQAETTPMAAPASEVRAAVSTYLLGATHNGQLRSLAASFRHDSSVDPAASHQALQLVRRKGAVVLVGLPPGTFATPIFDVVLKRITIRGSIVGSRQDLAEALTYAASRRTSPKHSSVTPVSRPGPTPVRR
jgi:D-arabinose 1-dehydrogenase-like Zn-dependent alcohol dehydrogenase